MGSATGPFLIRKKWKKSLTYGKIADGARRVVTVSKSHLELPTASQGMEADTRKSCYLEAHDAC